LTRYLADWIFCVAIKTYVEPLKYFGMSIEKEVTQKLAYFVRRVLFERFQGLTLDDLNNELKQLNRDTKYHEFVFDTLALAYCTRGRISVSVSLTYQPEWFFTTDFIGYTMYVKYALDVHRLLPRNTVILAVHAKVERKYNRYLSIKGFIDIEKDLCVLYPLEDQLVHIKYKWPTLEPIANTLGEDANQELLKHLATILLYLDPDVEVEGPLKRRNPNRAYLLELVLSGLHSRRQPCLARLHKEGIYWIDYSVQKQAYGVKLIQTKDSVGSYLRYRLVQEDSTRNRYLVSSSTTRRVKL